METDGGISLGDALQVLGILIAILSAIWFGSRWTERIEGGISRIDESVRRSADTTERLRVENNADHIRILEKMDTHPAHSSLAARIEELGRRILNLEGRNGK